MAKGNTVAMLVYAVCRITDYMFANSIPFAFSFKLTRKDYLLESKKKKWRQVNELNSKGTYRKSTGNKFGY